MSVKRYDFDCITSDYLLGASLDRAEVADGDYVLHSDYAALLARHNKLKEAVKWMLYIDTPENFDGGKHIAARAEVERLLEEK